MNQTCILEYSHTVSFLLLLSLLFFPLPSSPPTVQYDDAHRSMTLFFLSNLPVIALFDLAPFPLGGMKDAITSLGLSAFKQMHPMCARFRAAVKAIDVESRAIIEER